MPTDPSWTRLAGRRLSRRAGLRISVAGTAAAGLAAVGCGGKQNNNGVSSGVSNGPARLAASPTSGATVSAGQSGGARGGSVNIVAVEIPSLDPFTIITQNAQIPAAIWYNRPYRFKSGPDVKFRQFEAEPELAAALPEIPDSGTTFTFKLRPDVHFHDKAPVNGRAVTAEDISYTFNRFRALSGRKTVFDVVDKVETPDAQTVVFHLKAPSASFLGTLADGSFLHVIPKELVDPGNNSAKGDPIGAGAWVFDSYQAGVVATASANPNYFRGRPKIDKLQYLIIPEHASQAAAFRTGKVDTFAPTVDELQSIQSIPVVQVDSNLTGSPYFVSFDLTGIFKDIRLRRAVSMALDRDKFNQTFYQGKGEWCTALPAGFVPWYLDPKASGYGATTQYLKYDPNAAKALIKQAGYGGEAVKLSSSTQFVREQIELTAAMLQAVGFNIQINLLEHAAFIQTINAGINLAGGLGWVVKASYADPSSYLQIYWAPGSPNQNTRFNDPDILEMITKQDRTIDTSARAKIIQDVQIAIAERAYGAFLATPPVFAARSGRVQNYYYVDNVSGIEGWAAASLKA